MPCDTMEQQIASLPKDRSPDYLHGWRAATKYAVRWLYGRAQAMNDPNARAVLNVSADEFGKLTKRAWQGDATLPSELMVSPIDLMLAEQKRTLERDVAIAQRDALLAVARAVNQQMIDGEVPVLATVEDAMCDLPPDVLAMLDQPGG